MVSPWVKFIVDVGLKREVPLDVGCVVGQRALRDYSGCWTQKFDVRGAEVGVENA